MSGRREAPLGQPAGVLGEVLVGALAGLFDLIADHAQLLVQEELALRALDALLHLAHDLVLHGEHGVLLGQGLDQGEEALLRGFHLQERLLLGGVDLQVRSHHVGDLLGIGGLTDHMLHLVGELRIELHVLSELGRHAARQGTAAHESAVGRRQRRGDREEVRLGAGKTLDAHALLALDERLDAAVRQLEQLQHADPRADGHDVGGVRFLDRGLALRAQDERSPLVEGRLDGLDRLLAAHEEGRDHLRKDDQIASGQQRQSRGRRVAVRQTLRHAAAPPSPPR